MGERGHKRHKVLRTKKKKKDHESRAKRRGSSRGRVRCATDGLLDAEMKKVGISFTWERATTHFSRDVSRTREIFRIVHAVPLDQRRRARDPFFDPRTIDRGELGEESIIEERSD